MGIFDIFTGEPAAKAAAQQRQFLEGEKKLSREDIEAALRNATGYANTGATAGRTALGTGYDTSRGDITGGTNQALNFLDEGSLAALSSLRTAGDSFAPLSALGSKYGAATDTYLGALGVNGQDAQTQARAAFQTTPGYNFNLDQGLEAINRRRNAAGMLGSGNADRDAQIFGAGLASQEHDKWLGNLGSFVNPELSATTAAATGLAGINRDEANLLNTTGTNRANIAATRGGMLADLAKTYGQNIAGLETNLGNTLAGLETNAAGQKVGVTTSLAPAYSQTYKNEADAKMAGSGNLWSLGLNAAKLGTSFLGGGTGFNFLGGGIGGER